MPTEKVKPLLPPGTSAFPPSATPILPTPPPAAAISVTALQNPPKPYQIPPTIPQPSTNNLALGTNAVVATAATDANTPPPTSTPGQSNVDTILAPMRASLQTIVGGQAAAADKIRTEAGLADKKQKAEAVSNELDQLDKGYRDEVLQLKANPGGFVGSALQNKVNEITDRYQNNRANIALTYKVLAGDFNAAQQIVEDKVSSLEKQTSQQIQLYQLAADAIHNDLTDSEKLQVQANLQAKQDEAKILRETYSTALQNAVQNGAPASVLSAIDDASRQKSATAASVLAAAGRYGVDAQVQAELENTRANTANTYSTIAARSAASEAPTLNGKPQTAVQVQVQGYADRTNQADQIIGNIGAQFTGTASYAGKLLPNFLKSSDRQQYEQAQRNFVNAVLRRESGAVISKEEFANAEQQYFPQPGDSAEVVVQKAANRQTVINSLYKQGNVQRAALPGQIIQGDDGKTYKVGDDGETLVEL